MHAHPRPRPNKHAGHAHAHAHAHAHNRCARTHTQQMRAHTVLISSKSATTASIRTLPSAPQSHFSTGSATLDDVGPMLRISRRPPSLGSRRPILGPYQPRGDRAELAQKASAARRRSASAAAISRSCRCCRIPHRLPHARQLQQSAVQHGAPAASSGAPSAVQHGAPAASSGAPDSMRAKSSSRACLQ